jgi:hypothetical protein
MEWFCQKAWIGAATALLAACLLLLVTASAARAAQSQSNDNLVCDEAAAYAAGRTGVPADVLRALTRAETGRRQSGHFVPWPWTVNMEGAGKWFETPDQALQYALSNYQLGARSFDVGCFQINFRWHGDAFPSIEAMFEPYANALYAANFIRSLYLELGSWQAAAGAYHSRTPEHANRYSDRFGQILAGLDPAGEVALTGQTTEAMELAQLSEPLRQPEFAPLVPRSNSSGSLFTAVDGASGLLTSATGSLFLAGQ